MASKWTDMDGVSDGMLADYEVLAKLIDNTQYLKNTAIEMDVFNNPSGISYKSSSRGIKFKAGIILFNFAGPSAKVSKSFGSTTRPLVFATVVGGGGKVSVYVENASTKGADFIMKKTGTGTVKGYVNWLAITTE